MNLTPAPGLNGQAPAAQSLFDPPAFNTPPVAPGAPAAKPHAGKNDVTGSIPDAAVAQTPDRHDDAIPVKAEQLPVAIGSDRLRKAAIAGDGSAAYEVGIRLAEGHGGPANLQEAAQWFARAADSGLAPAQFRYASMLEKGQGVKKDQRQARDLYLAAAKQGHAKAMHNLAVLYAQGIDGKPDYAAAVKWFEQAARHGIADSQYNLGILTARGFGTETDLAASYKWFSLAAAQGDQESAKKRDEVAKHLDPAALAAAEQAVKAFAVEPQPKAALAIPKPPGGWDSIDAATARPVSPAKAKTATTAPTTPMPPHAPLSLGSFTIGKQ
jgi:localization factor PodJL